MPRNVEVKARVHDPVALRRRVEALSDGPAERLRQLDTFYVVANGRLKLRVLAPDCCELIHYNRPDELGAKESRYRIARFDDAELLSRLLAAALELRGNVTKTRHVYLAGQTRIHLDDVEHLGHFVELEVVLTSDQTVEEGRQIAEELVRALAIEDADRVSGAYLDLLQGRAGAGA